MKERLIQLLDLEQLSPSKFADIIGVQRSSISHVISGRNKPSFDFLERTLKAFPGLNAAWLMLGEGTMYEQMGRKVTGNLFDTPPETILPSAEQASISEPVQKEPGLSGNFVSGKSEPSGEKDSPGHGGFGESAIKAGVLGELAEGSRKRIVQVMVIYDDDTFRAYNPAN